MSCVIFGKVSKGLKEVQKNILWECLGIFVKKLDLPKVGESGHFVDYSNIDWCDSMGMVEHEVAESGVDCSSNKNRWFDYNMKVGKWLMNDRYNPEGYFYFLTKEEHLEFVRIYKPVLDMV